MNLLISSLARLKTPTNKFRQILGLKEKPILDKKDRNRKEDITRTFIEWADAQGITNSREEEKHSNIFMTLYFLTCMDLMLLVSWLYDYSSYIVNAIKS